MARLRREPTTKPLRRKKSNASCHAQMGEKCKMPAETDYSLRWLIAIDIGTTQLYIRYKRPHSDEELSIDGYNAYDAYDGDGAIIPTDLYYPPDGSRPTWGREIRMQQGFSQNPYDRRRLVRFWKPAIHQAQDDGWYHIDLKAQATYIFGVPDVSRFAKDFFGLVFDFLFHRETGYFYKEEQEQSFQIELASMILSKPSGWPRSEYLIFQDAAENWGLKGQISFVSETDALAKSWLRREAERWKGLKVGFSMIVVDWGGGTVDIDALEISSFDRNEPEKIQVRPSGTLAKSLRHGSETSLELFANHIRSRFSNAGYPTEKLGEMVDRAVFQFSQMKAGFRPNQGSSQWSLDIPEVLGGRVPLEESEFKQQFEPSIKATTDAIDGIIAELQKSRGKLPDTIIIGGGGSAFSFYFDSLVDRYGRSGSFPKISVTRVHDFKRGVAMGAIHLRQDITGFLKYSLSRESYAIPCRIEDVAGADRDRMLALYPGLRPKQNIKDGKFYFPIPVLQWFIKAGDCIGPNFVIRPDDDSGVYGVRQAEITKKEDLRFEEHLVIYRGHPGLDRWTPYDSQSMREENYRMEKLIVDLRSYIEPKELPRMNSKKGDLNRRVRRLDYDYSVEFEGETPNFFLQFKKPGEDTPTKLRVHTSEINLARLEAHQSLSRDIPSSPSSTDVLSADDDSSGCMLELDETILSSETSSVRVAPKLQKWKEQRAAGPALTALSSNKQDMSMKRTSGRLIETFETDISSSILLQYNDSEISAMTQDCSSPNPHPSFLGSYNPSIRAHKILSRPLKDATRHQQEPILDRSPIAIATNEFDSGARPVTGDTENVISSTPVDRPCEALAGIHPKTQSRVPLQTKTRAPPILRTVAPGRRITRQAISEALAPLSPNVRRRKVTFYGVGEKETVTSNIGGRLQDSLLPVPSKRQKTTLGIGSKF